ncbi:MAG: dTDP-4-dehydrorhamnose 3,5-epimerase [Blastocatellia bacterium]
MIPKPAIDGLMLLQNKVFPDERGFFVERFHELRFREHGLYTSFIQDNHSRSVPGVIRGLHYQYNPPQGKLVGVIRGRILDVAVDLRPESPTYGQHEGIELSDENGLMLWIPPGFAHGFCVLGHEPADVLYKVDGVWNAACEGGILWNDQDLNIAWPVENPIVSGKDQQLPAFASYRENPIDWNRYIKQGQASAGLPNYTR